MSHNAPHMYITLPPPNLSLQMEDMKQLVRKEENKHRQLQEEIKQVKETNIYFRSTVLYIITLKRPLLSRLLILPFKLFVEHYEIVPFVNIMSTFQRELVNSGANIFVNCFKIGCANCSGATVI